MASSRAGMALRIVSVVERPRDLPRPLAQPWLFATSMAAALLVAVMAGIVLALLAIFELSIGGERWTSAVQAHGRIQLLSFAGAFIVALALEFLPRMNQRPPFSRAVRAGVPAGLVAGGLLLGAGQLWWREAPWLAWPGAVLTVGASAWFAAIAWRLEPPLPLATDPQPLFFRIASAWLLAAALFASWFVLRAEAGTVMLDDSRIATEVFLRGFVMLAITAVGLRAFVGHLGLKPLTRRRQLTLLVLLIGSLLVWLLGQEPGVLPGWSLAARAGNATYGATLVLMPVWMGLLPRVFTRQTREAYERLIPAAWLGAVTYGAVLTGTALVGASPGLYEEGALRHVFLLGFMVPLMLAMSHVVLARFGTGTIPSQRLLTVAFWLAMSAVPLRVLAPVLGDADEAATQGVMGVAGMLLMAALALAAIVCLRTAFAVARRRSVSRVSGRIGLPA